MNPQVVSYLRVSTSAQGKSGLGIEAQRGAIVRFVEQENLELVGENVGLGTGKGSDALDRRRVLRKFLAQARKQRASIVAAKLDRLSRDVVLISSLMVQKVPFIVTELGFDADPFMLHIYAALAERACPDCRSHTCVALNQAKARGKQLGNRTNLAEAGKKGAAAGRQAADAFTANVLPIVRQMHAAGLTTLTQIADALNACGIHTARGGSWHPSTVKSLLAGAQDHVMNRLGRTVTKAGR